MNVVTSERNAEGETAMGNGASGAIRVLIADDHPLIIAGVRRTIEQSEDFEVVGEARSGPELMTLVERQPKATTTIPDWMRKGLAPHLLTI